MANPIIKRINVGGATYDLADEYARGRIEGLATVYSISCQYAHATGNTYVDWDNGEDVAYSAMTILNGKFNSSNENITISASDVTTGTSGYIVLLSTKSANKYYAKKMVNMNLGDTVYVVETAPIADRWLSSFSSSPLSATFTAMEGKIDLSDYVKKGTYASAGPSTNATGSAGGATITTSSAGSATATGTATVTYQKADAATGSAGAQTVNTGNAGAATVNAASAGAHTHSVSGNVDSHTHGTAKTVLSDVTFTANGNDTFGAGALPALTITNKEKVAQMSATAAVDVVTGVSAVSASTDTVNKSYTHTDPAFNTVSVVTGYPNFSGGSLNAATAINVIKTVSAPTASVMDASVTYDSVNCLLTFGSKTVVTGVSTTTASVVPSYTLTAATLGTASSTVVLRNVKTAGGITSGGAITVVTGVSGGAVTGTEKLTPITVGSASGWSAGSLPTFTQGSKAALTKSTVSVVGDAAAATLAVSGTAASAGAHTHSVTIANHSHSVTIASHTHSIGLSDATATGTAAVAVGNHTHSVTVAAHTHTLSNHTHNITFS